MSAKQKQSIFLKTNLSPLKWDSSYIPKPSHHPTNKDIIIISTNKGIFEYNLKENRSREIHNFGVGFEDNLELYICQFTDTENEMVYIFGDGELAIFDLRTETMQINDGSLDELGQCGSLSRAAYIPSPISQCHILSNDSSQHVSHVKVDLINKTIIPSKIAQFETISFPKLLYVPFKKQLMSLGSDRSDKIFYCDIQTRDQSGFEWQLSDLKMPYIVSDELCYDTLLAFDNIIFVFYFETDHDHDCDIWCLDLLHNKFVETMYEMPPLSTLSNKYVLKSSNNMGHILNFSGGEHYEFNMHDLMPKEVIKSHRKYYEPLIMGFIKEFEKGNDTQNVPYVLKYLVLQYFQLFS